MQVLLSVNDSVMNISVKEYGYLTSKHSTTQHSHETTEPELAPKNVFSVEIKNSEVSNKKI